MTNLIKPSGPLDASIAIVGDYPRQQDVLVGRPFMSKGGQELSVMLESAGIRRSECYLTTVFKELPKNDDIKSFCGKKAEVGGKAYTLPPIATGAYVRPEHLHYLLELAEELERVRPNVVVALGNVATWALLGTGSISKTRGIIAASTLVPGLKIIPTYHPASIFKQWGNRPIVLLDLIKAKKESTFSEIIRPYREIWIRPTLDDIDLFVKKYIEPASKITVDIETKNKQITCIGFGADASHAICIPFTDQEKHNWSYWKSPWEEIQAWKKVIALCLNNKEKIGQNGMYDMTYLLWVMGIPLRHYTEDTMLKMHSLYSELQKGLGFLASIFTNEASWKGMHRVRTKELDSAKKDD